MPYNSRFFRRGFPYGYTRWDSDGGSGGMSDTLRVIEDFLAPRVVGESAVAPALTDHGDVTVDPATGRFWICNTDEVGAGVVDAYLGASFKGHAIPTKDNTGMYQCSATGAGWTFRAWGGGGGGAGPTTLTGDVTGSGTGTVPVTHANTGVIAGTYSNANVTVDSKGRVLSAANGSSVGTVTLTGDVTGSGPGSVPATLAATGVIAGAYANANVTVDAKGRVTSIAAGTPSGALDCAAMSAAHTPGVIATLRGAGCFEEATDALMLRILTGGALTFRFVTTGAYPARSKQLQVKTATSAFTNIPGAAFAITELVDCAPGISQITDTGGANVGAVVL